MPQEPRKKRTRPIVPYGGQVDTGESSDKAPPASGKAEPGSSTGPRPAVLLLVFLVLAAMGWFLIQNLTRASKDQDCMMAGRKNCAPIDTASLRK